MTGEARPTPREPAGTAPSADGAEAARESSFGSAMHRARDLLLQLSARIQQLVPWSVEPDHRAVRAREHLARLTRRLHQPAGAFHPTGVRHELALLAERFTALATRRLISESHHDELTALLGEISRALPGQAFRRPRPEPTRSLPTHPATHPGNGT